MSALDPTRALLDGRARDPPFAHARGLYANHRGQALHELLPILPFVDGTEKLAAARAEVNARRMFRVHCHGIAQDSFVRALLRQPTSQRFPRLSGIARAINPQPALRTHA